ncbi:MAG TPA: hypothetical protein VL749_09725 [Patescibacteria group bacterium]|nr:hypothetical protein [Patescibacteria group bacterium]
MLLNRMAYELAQERREREIADRQRERAHKLESTSVRRAIGRSIIAIGHRIAAEPQPRLARSQ